MVLFPATRPTYASTSNPCRLNVESGLVAFDPDQVWIKRYTESLPARKYPLASCFITVKSHPAGRTAADTPVIGMVGLLVGRSSAHAVTATTPQAATKYLK